MAETTRVTERAVHEADTYRGQNPRPLGGYVVVIGIYSALVGLAALVAVLTGRSLPKRWSVQDTVMLALGTHKLSRTLAKDAVTSPLRAPFAHYAGTGGPAEVHEETRNDNTLRHGLGELLTCPFCLGMWVATGFTIGLVFAPRITRSVAATFAALTGADFLQLAYAMAQRSAAG